MTNTKEQILTTALRLFARDGYEAVSVSMIAGELGITKGALYKHYKNKQDIFDSIVARMYELDAKQAQTHDVPEETYDAQPDSYEEVTFASVKAFTIAQFHFWTEDTFASNFRRMLSLEQYRNPEMASLYQNCLTAGPVSYMEDIFREMIKKDVLKPADPNVLAVTFFAPLYLLIQISDHTKNCDALIASLCGHIDAFIKHYAVDPS